jgi:hypothetical protein
MYVAAAYAVFVHSLYMKIFSPVYPHLMTAFNCFVYMTCFQQLGCVICIMDTTSG